LQGTKKETIEISNGREKMLSLRRMSPVKQWADHLRPLSAAREIALQLHDINGSTMISINLLEQGNELGLGQHSIGKEGLELGL
jgi:hypothetical protein